MESLGQRELGEPGCPAMLSDALSQELLEVLDQGWVFWHTASLVWVPVQIIYYTLPDNIVLISDIFSVL